MNGLKSLVAATAVVAIGSGAVLAGIATSSGSDGPARSAPAAIASEPSATSTSSTVVVDPTAADALTTDGQAGTTTTTADTVGTVHERLVGPTAPGRGDSPVDDLGQVDLSGKVPAGLDLTALPDEIEVPNAHTPAGSGGGSLSAGPWCQYQCIRSGIAYPRGFGAELVVETKVAADIFMSVVVDGDGDGDYELVGTDDSPGKVKSHSWALDHLDPGQTYYVMVTATDQYDDTSYAWGEFTTLSTRTVEVTVNDVEVIGGPGNVIDTDTHLRAGGEAVDDYGLGTWVDLGQTGRTTDVDLVVVRSWDGKVCETPDLDMFDAPHGDSDDSCLSWNTASGHDLDMDAIHASASHWSSVTFARTLTVDAGGPSLPPGYGDPRWFSTTAVATFHVVYGK